MSVNVLKDVKQHIGSSVSTVSSNVSEIARVRPEQSWWPVIYAYSVYQIVLVMIVVLFPQWCSFRFKDYVRAASLIVALTWLILYVYVGPSKLVQYYRNTPYLEKVPTQVLYFLDICIHFLPVLLVGLPQSSFSYAIAIGIILIWYSIFRPMWSHLYGFVPPRITDMLFFIVAPIAIITLSYAHIRRVQPRARA